MKNLPENKSLPQDETAKLTTNFIFVLLVSCWGTEQSQMLFKRCMHTYVTGKILKIYDPERYWRSKNRFSLANFIGNLSACFLTIKKTPETPFSCPFCLVPNFEAAYRGPKTNEQIQIELEDQRKVEELRTKIRQEEIEADRQRELKRQREREASKAKTITSPTPVPDPPPNSPSSHIGSPTLPAKITEMHRNAKTPQEIDAAELEYAIWLSLNAHDSPP